MIRVISLVLTLDLDSPEGGAPKDHQTSHPSYDWRFMKAWTARNLTSCIIGVLAFQLTASLATEIGRSAATPRVPRLDRVASNVFRMSGEALTRPVPVRGRPTVLVMGSSQLYCVPADRRGEVGLEDSAGSTVDALASTWGDERVVWERYALPILLPSEIIALAGRRVTNGDPPALVIVEINWDAIAHYRHFRMGDLIADPSFEAALLARLRRSGAHSSIIESLHNYAEDARRAPHSSPRVVDRGEQIVAEFVRTHGLSILGNLQIQEGLQRGLFEPIFALLGRGSRLTAYELVPQNLEFNLQALRALARLLQAEHIPLLAYRVPERTSLPPPTERDGAPEALANLTRDLEKSGAVVLDLHAIMPERFWGWRGQVPDRYHFSVPGHARLAEALVAQGTPLGAFRRLSGPRS